MAKLENRNEFSFVLLEGKSSKLLRIFSFLFWKHEIRDHASRDLDLDVIHDQTHF